MIAYVRVCRHPDHKAMAARKDSDLGGKSSIQIGRGKGMAKGRKGKSGEEENHDLY